jgi:hypothetical protein
MGRSDTANISVATTAINDGDADSEQTPGADGDTDLGVPRSTARG